MPNRCLRRFLTLLALATLPVTISQPAPARAQLYYCPELPADQQFTAQPGAGCVPLAQDEKERQAGRDDDRPRSTSKPPVDLSNLTAGVAQFVQRYNSFVECCADDPARLDKVTELGDDANALLLAIQRGMASEAMKLRGFTLRELVDPVAKASLNLIELTSQLESLRDLQEQLYVADYETAGRVRRAIAEAEDAIRRRFQPLRLPESGRTGTDIQDTTVPARVGGGGDTTLPTAGGRTPGAAAGDTDSLGSRSGPGIGKEASSGSNIGQTPATGFGIGEATGPTGRSSLPTRAGPNIGE